MRVTYLISALLCLVFFLGGYVVFDIFNDRDPDFPDPGPQLGEMERALPALLQFESTPPQLRNELRRSIREDLPALRVAANRTRQRLRDYRDVLVEPDFDPDAARLAARAVADAQHEQWLASSEIAINVFERLPDDLRLEFIEKRAAQRRALENVE